MSLPPGQGCSCQKLCRWDRDSEQISKSDEMYQNEKKCKYVARFYNCLTQLVKEKEGANEKKKTEAFLIDPFFVTNTHVTPRHVTLFCIDSTLINIIFVACDIGFVGLNCATQCSYPSFGRECQSECQCNKSLCNHAYGCLNPKGISHF